jgi:tetratricopeptide (TPR) repeat protein
MKKACPVCGNGKARRLCARHGDVEVCSRCCAETRDEDCGDCEHYAAARNYHVGRKRSGGLPDGHFMIEINPEIDAAVDHALVLLEGGDSARAMEELTALDRLYPQNHMVKYGLGTVHVMREELGEAIRYYDEALAIYPYLVEAHFNKAMAHRKQAEIGAAVRSFRKVIEISGPGESEAVKARGEIDFIKSLIRKSEGIELDVFLEAAEHFERAFSLMTEGDAEGALDGFRAALAKNENSAPTYGNMALCHARLGQKAEALVALDRALELDADYQPARDNRLVIEKMEEGRPLDGVPQKTIHFGRDGGGGNLPG